MRTILSLVLLSIFTATAESQSVVFVEHDRYAGATVRVGDLVIAYWSPDQLQATYGSGTTGDVYSVSWLHDNGFNGVQEINVTYERKLHETSLQAAREFSELVHAALQLYPPNVQTSLPALSARRDRTVLTATGFPALQGDTMSVSWQHDPDGEGPLAAINVTATTEKRPGESAAQTAKRLKDMVGALQNVYPPNVKQTAAVVVERLLVA